MFARFRAPGPCSSVCLARAIGAIAAFIALDLASDGAAMSSQLESDIGI